MIPFDEQAYYQMGWNHQLDIFALFDSPNMGSFGSDPCNLKIAVKKKHLLMWCINGD